MRYRENHLTTHLSIVVVLEIAAVIFVLFAIGCSKTSSDTVEPVLEPSGEIVSYSACKQEVAETLDTGELPSGTTCMTFNYDGESRLELTHVDLLANCCQTGLIGNITFDGTDIIITEAEKTDNGACRCICSYNMYFLISNIPPGNYHIKVNEFYQFEGYEGLEFDIVLAGKTSGSHCVNRP
ncbi:MAG: hypothetical protein R3F48_12110 [Candidatus Zixiibacteriota bacterium]